MISHDLELLDESITPVLQLDRPGEGEIRVRARRGRRAQLHLLPPA